MLSEGGKVSHKRFISLLFSVVASAIGIYITVRHEDHATTVLGYFLVAVGVMTGVTTIPQIVSLLRGTPPPPEQPKEDTEQPTE